MKRGLIIGKFCPLHKGHQLLIETARPPTSAAISRRLLRCVVPSSFDPLRFSSREDWATAVTASEVRLQWDPDHDPAGRPVERRAVQLGLRGSALRNYGEQHLISVEVITSFVVEQRQHVIGDFENLHTPEERIYHPVDRSAADFAGIDSA